MAAAWELAEQGHAVTIYERSGVFGGLASGFPLGDQSGVFLDKFYHHIFRSDTDIIALIHRMGLAHRLEWHADKSCIFAHGREWALQRPWDILRCRPIGSVADRLRFAYASYRLQSARDWRHLDSLTCGEFYKEAGAENGYRNFWSPLLAAKFGRQGQDAPAAFLWGRIVARRGSNSDPMGRLPIGYLRGGFQRLIDRVVDCLAGRANCELRNGETVQEVWLNDFSSVSVRTARGVFEYDWVISTIPLTILAGLVKGADPDLLNELRSVEYMAAVCLILRLNERLTDYYWTNVLDPELSMGVVIEHTNLVPIEDYGATHVVYVANYLPQGHPWLRAKLNDIFAIHSDSLSRMYNRWKPKSVVNMRLIRAGIATPIYRRGHGRLAARLAQCRPLGRIWLADMTQVYPEDRNMSHCIRLGARVARMAMAEAAARRS
ncbi:MAG: FAD-dependent oxidoreductase [candidate division NC10 bacterium]|nr:FAD-dependent oxidoreductase [candidate division NC10 bacterium]